MIKMRMQEIKQFLQEEGEMEPKAEEPEKVDFLPKVISKRAK